MTTATASVPSFPPGPLPSGFVPADLDAARWEAVEPLVVALRDRPIADAAAFERWILDRSDLDAACAEARATLYIATSCDTEDAALGARFNAYLEQVAPRLETAAFDLDRRQVELAARFRLDPDRYAVIERSKRAAVELFRAENVPIQTELAKMSQEFAKVSGAQTVAFEGEERTLPQMAPYSLRPDRPLREAAWRAVAARRLQDRDRLDELLDGMVERRDRMARNAGKPTFVEYAFADKQRFDYAPDDCRTYWDAVAQHVVPLVRRMDERRRRALGVEPLRPWDLAVDVAGRPGLTPFQGGRELMEKSVRVMDALDPRLGAMLRRLGPEGAGGADAPNGHALSNGKSGYITDHLDLDSRKGKRPGGYQYMRDRTRRPFIFMNAAGLQRDVMTMVHEAGHAFHSMLCAGDPLVEYRHSPIEFAEVASMSMEHLTMPYWASSEGRGYYASEEEAARARREHLEDSISILAWIATIDAFQHWMYRNPKHTRAERDAHWLELDARFGRAVSWEGLDAERASAWQKQSHLFSHPMYYIEYGIAQLGSLQLWLKSKREGERAAVDAYIRALTLGGSRPLPALFEAAGLRFDFGEATVARVVEAVEAELAKLG